MQSPSSLCRGEADGETSDSRVFGVIVWPRLKREEPGERPQRTPARVKPPGGAHVGDDQIVLGEQRSDRAVEDQTGIGREEPGVEASQRLHSFKQPAHSLSAGRGKSVASALVADAHQFSLADDCRRVAKPSSFFMVGSHASSTTMATQSICDDYIVSGRPRGAYWPGLLLVWMGESDIPLPR